MKDGELTKDNAGRWCKTCNREHGFLYPCKHYPQEILDEVLKNGKKFRELCFSGEIKFTKNGTTKTFNEWEIEGDL